MSKFDLVTEKFASVPYMREAQAAALRELIIANQAENILEIGFYQGKSSTYIAAILEDQKRGHLTTIDLKSAVARKPNIHDLLDACDLAHRVTPVIAHRSYTWELQKMIHAGGQRFDFCYFDGGHTWDGTGFGVLLVDMLLKPGGILLLDDMSWSIAGSPYFQSKPALAERYSEDEAATETVRRVSELILPHLGYTMEQELTELRWGVARKARTAR